MFRKFSKNNVFDIVCFILVSIDESQLKLKHDSSDKKNNIDLNKFFRVIIITEGKLYMYLKGGISNTIFTRNFNHKQFAKYLVFVFRMGLAELVLTDYIQGYSVGLLFRQQRWIVGKF